jgi:hypothetical protein
LAEFKKAATVTALLLVKDANTESLLLKVIERLGNLEFGGGRKLLKDLGTYLLTEGSDGLAASNLAGGVEGRLDAISGHLIGDLEHPLVHIEEGELALRFAGLGDKLLLGSDERTGLLAGEVEGLLEVLFGELVGSTLDHDHILAVADIDEVEIAVLQDPFLDELLGPPTRIRRRPATTARLRPSS